MTNESEKTEKKEMNEIVLPGEFIGDKKGRRMGHGVFFDGEKVHSKIMGIPRMNDLEISVIPLSGKYIPQFGDKVIGIIKEVETSGWLVDINSPYKGFLPVSEAVDDFIRPGTDITRYFDVDNIIFCNVSRVTKNKNTQISMRDSLSRKLFGGIIVKVTPSKIPRIIGRAGSMIQLIKNKTKTDIFTGQNGLVWIRGDNKANAIEAIEKINKESHTNNLTEKIEKMYLEERVKLMWQ